MILVALSSCMGDKAEKALEGKILETESLIDNRQLIREGKKHVKKAIKYGPKVEDIDNSAARENTHFVIDKDEAPNYDQIQDDGKGNVFPIDFSVENVDVRTFTQMLSQITGINFLVSDEVSGTVTAKLQDVSWPNALDSVLNLKGLAKHVDNDANIIRIHSQSVITQLENFERQRKEDLQKTAMLDRATATLYTEIFKLFYTQPDEVKTILENVLGISGAAAPGSRNTNAQITIDPRVNQLIIKARKEDLDIIGKLIKKIDSRTKQVFIEAFIVEVTDGFDKALGIKLGADLSQDIETGNSDRSLQFDVTGGVGADSSFYDFGIATATSGLSFTAGIADVASLRGALTALEKEEVSKVLSNPRIFTLDNQEATIFQGVEIPYETVSADGTSIQFKSAGLNLSVTPQVVGDGNLMMSLSINKDTADTSQDNPPITSSSINTNLITKDGSIVVIGGIYSQNKSNSSDKVPFFGDIPGAGALFRNDSRKNSKQELMIFIAPRVI